MNIVHGAHEYEVVGSIPKNYVIWNIANMAAGYLPLVQCGGCDGYQVIGVKKAVKCDGAQVILDAIGGGQCTIAEMERYIKRYRNAKPGTWSCAQKDRMILALPFMKKLNWD